MLGKKIKPLMKTSRYFFLLIIVILFQANQDGKDDSMSKNINELWKNVEKS